MPVLTEPVPLSVVAFASPVYWPDEEEAREAFETVRDHLDGDVPQTWHLVRRAEDLDAVRAALPETLAVFVPLSGGTQPLMAALAGASAHVGLLNAYLPDVLPDALGSELLERNAHPACTDFFAFRRRHGLGVFWLAGRAAFDALGRAHQAVERLRRARFLKVGETEPWVINSTREPDRFREALGCEVVPVDAETIYAAIDAVPDEAAAPFAESWLGGAGGLSGPAAADVLRAGRVYVALRDLLDAHGADALSMACFSLIEAADTTSCLALSALNDAADRVGACEGDLDAAVTLFLLKALGSDFVWIANPVVHPGGIVDLAHCTAPRCACGTDLAYRLLRHHESGRGVAPEVRLPTGRSVTLARIGDDLTRLAVHGGWTERVPKQRMCHTQIRVHLGSTERFLDTLLGTHQVMAYGDLTRELACCAALLGLGWLGPDVPAPDLFIPSGRRPALVPQPA